MTVPLFILAGQSNAARLSSDIEAALNAEYGVGNYELVRVYDAGAPLTRERADQPDWSNPEELREELTDETVNALLEDPDRVFGGMIWIQGEADTFYPYGANQYADKLEGVFDEFRDDISSVFGDRDVGIDDGPITILELSQNAPDAPARAEWDTIIDAQRDVAARDPQVETINPDTIAQEANIPADEMFDDGLHYAGEIGSVIANELVETLVPETDEPEPVEDDAPLPVIEVVDEDVIDASAGSDDHFALGGLEWLLGVFPVLGLMAGFA